MREIDSSNISIELDNIGYDRAYKPVIVDKFRYKNIKISNLSLPQANILKQTALIYGADCAVHRDVVLGNIEKSDVILCGSYSQIKKITKRLKNQPFSLKVLAEEILEFLNNQTRRTKLVGILNVTPDSFSDGGMYFSPKDAQKQLLQLIEDGSDVVDIGAESTRPFSKPVTPEEQIERLKPIIDFIKNENISTEISIDTRSAKVAEYVLDNGAQIINDVSGFDYDKNLPSVVAKYSAKVIIQHSIGNSESECLYENILEDVFKSLKEKIAYAHSIGVSDIIIDPGIGFGKNKRDNIQILDNIDTFFSLKCPVMVGLSRKRFLGVEDESNDLKDTITLAYSYPLIKKGVDYLRVHNVKLHKLLLNNIPT